MTREIKKKREIKKMQNAHLLKLLRHEKMGLGGEGMEERNKWRKERKEINERGKGNKARRGFSFFFSRMMAVIVAVAVVMVMVGHSGGGDGDDDGGGGSWP